MWTERERIAEDLSRNAPLPAAPPPDEDPNVGKPTPCFMSVHFHDTATNSATESGTSSYPISSVACGPLITP